MTESHAGLCKLTETLAEALDDVVSSGEKRYVVGQIGRVYLLALGTLLMLDPPDTSDSFEQLLAEIAKPSHGGPDGRWASG